MGTRLCSQPRSTQQYRFQWLSTTKIHTLRAVFACFRTVPCTSSRRVFQYLHFAGIQRIGQIILGAGRRPVVEGYSGQFRRSMGYRPGPGLDQPQPNANDGYVVPLLIYNGLLGIYPPCLAKRESMLLVPCIISSSGESIGR